MQGFKLFESQNNIYYWVASKKMPVSTGFRLQPGETTFTEVKYFQRNTAEQVFEKVRREFRPQAPSRLGAIFLCPTAETCNYYKRVYKDHGGLYQVRVESGERPFLTDGDVWGDGFRWISKKGVYESRMVSFEEAYEIGKGFAEEYWMGGRRHIEKPELILPGSAKVIVIGPASTTTNKWPDFHINPDYEGEIE